ncbi:protein O-mannosyl-transferase family [Sphingobacterium corticis]|uniref:Protein O-mannosyl-transferase family n=1 Tax=Sphingobacterium corticis TaxID=1812823 RepID=A0ABW5NNI7_9SPHI
MNFNKWNNAIGWLCGLLATGVYVLTADSTTSWWDTGEFIASAYKMQIVHQPGAPLFLMIQNIFSNLAGGDASKIAFWMNVGSAICSGMTIVFLCWTITALVRKVMVKRNETPDGITSFQILSAGAIGALAYAFTDTFWYSAVESEVYAMSSLCTAAVVWLALKWAHRSEQADSNRWLLLVAYVMGLSIGVHLLNLLTIPAIALLIYFEVNRRTDWKGITKTLLIGVGALGLILWGIIQYSVKIAAYIDLAFVNSLSLPFGSGITFFAILSIGALVYGLRISQKRNKPILNTAILGVCFVLFGYSSYVLLPIRAQTEIALNNNTPDNVFSFYGYLTREQYPSEPLFKGPAFNAQAIDVEDQTFYRKDADKYTSIFSGREYTYDNEMLFPRVWSDRHASFYQSYLSLQDGESPSQRDNLSFFVDYQLNHMYWRYFMWNFVGRQNDTPNPTQTAFSGNWLSGIPAIDDLRLGGQQSLDEILSKDPSRNTYFFLPLLMGIAGLIWHIRKNKRDALVLSLLFFFTGIAIVLYLNQSPLQPRERDYAYAGSFYMFSIWIGMGVLGITEILRKRVQLRWATMSATAVCLLAAPTLLIKENWDDHDRSDRTMAKHMASNYLESCAPNAILFTYTDNDTFPLWYLQEVEGVRRDVRVINIGYLQSDWYLKQLMNDQVDLARLPIDIEPQKIAKGVRDGLMFVDMHINKPVDVKTLLEIMLSDNPSNQVQMQNGQYANILPTKNFQLAIDKDAVVANQAVPKA